MTAYLAFKPSLQNGHCIPEILALPDTQEISNTQSTKAPIQLIYGDSVMKRAGR